MYEGDLSKLSGKQEAIGMTESVLINADVGGAGERGRADHATLDRRSVVGEAGDDVLCGSVVLNVRENRVSVKVLLLKVRVTNLEKAVGLVIDADVPRDSNRSS